MPRIMFAHMARGAFLSENGRSHSFLAFFARILQRHILVEFMLYNRAASGEQYRKEERLLFMDKTTELRMLITELVKRIDDERTLRCIYILLNRLYCNK
jgi:hypothetical protein